MKVLLVAVMMMLTPKEDDVYIFEKPTFDTINGCNQFVVDNIQGLTLYLQREFDGRSVRSYLCMPKHAVDTMIDKIKKGLPLEGVGT